jgi:hypothetical protein
MGLWSVITLQTLIISVTYFEVYQLPRATQAYWRYFDAIGLIVPECVGKNLVRIMVLVFHSELRNVIASATYEYICEKRVGVLWPASTYIVIL